MSMRKAAGLLAAFGVWAGCNREKPPTEVPPPARQATSEKQPASPPVDAETALSQEPLFATSLLELGGALYGGLSFSVSRAELWRTDGTPKGTWRVVDLAPGREGAAVQMLGANGGLLYFTAPTPEAGTGVWRSDGTATGTRLLFPLELLVSRLSFATVKGRAVILVEAFQSRSRELWSTDGTPEGSRPLLGRWESRDELQEPSGLAVLEGRVYFSAHDRDAGTELWSSDGTPEGTRRVKDIVAGPYGSSPTHLTTLGGKLYFRVDISGTQELWTSDGTPEGTERIEPLPGHVPSEGWVLAGNTLFFELVPNDGGAVELWKVDGTSWGAVRLGALASADKSRIPQRLGALGGKVFFWNHTPKTGTELWTSDGTRGGMSLLKDLAPGPASSTPREWAVVNGTLYFQATTPGLGFELWKTDGTPEGTVLVKDLIPGVEGGDPRPVASLGGTLFFNVSRQGRGELWRTDGTPQGTVPMRVLERFVPKPDKK
ncbi:ELWxxDGT repeat protein [Archangium sp.]|jgi:ELWxxDGT repeat protein|uniref:ELWxxDGT repeat protein n=1 Tax=Archangium sp. TaxID=1872627 RepID=UPI002ED88532